MDVWMDIYTRVRQMKTLKVQYKFVKQYTDSTFAIAKIKVLLVHFSPQATLNMIHFCDICNKQ